VSVTLANREAEIMDVLWEQGPSTVAEVRQKLSVELAYTTVLTILRNLEAKGYVGHEAEGRAHRYFPRIKQQAARKSAIRHLAGKLFQGSADLLLTQLVADRRLSEDQVRRIREILDEEKPRKEKS
jgi:BlaI family transcriptional regulator, penicillinase repressor